jgi:hypothetical protein
MYNLRMVFISSIRWYHEDTGSFPFRFRVPISSPFWEEGRTSMNFIEGVPCAGDKQLAETGSFLEKSI